MRPTFISVVAILICEQPDLALGKSLVRVMPRPGVDVSHAFRHTGYVDQRVRTDAHNILNHQLYHVRQVGAAPSSSPAAGSNPNGHAPIEKAAVPATNAAAMMANPAPACDKALTALNGVASNPSGIAVCYNVLMLNTSTGIFQADVRLYKIAAPTGDWATMDESPGKINTGLQYMGANVHTPSITPNNKRDVGPLVAEDVEEVVKRAAAPPQSIKNLTFIGQAHSDVLPQLKNVTIQQAMLTPMITLSGIMADGSVLKTMLSSADASFVGGLFQDSITGNTTAAAAAAVASAAKKAVFVLPGTTLGIFPIGLIITSAWAFLFICVVGYGTFGRIQFREAYRRRIKRGIASGSRTI